jgi:hypothetical protein
MVVQNAENQTLEAWRDYEDGKFQLDGNLCQGTGGTVSTIGSQSFTADRVNWPPDYSISISTGSTDGGILDQLINQTRNQLQELDAYAVKVRQQLEELENLRLLLQNRNESE